MGTIPRSRHRFTYAEYLEHESGATDKHEFYEGEIYAMAGGTPEHAALSAAMVTLLSVGLSGKPCRVFTSDLRVRVLASSLATYPDVTVVCGPLEYDPDSRVTVTNPKLVVEVSSDGTEDWDRGEKLELYQQIPALQECLIVSHREPGLELWRRGPTSGWSRHIAGRGEVLMLESVGLTLTVDDVYRRAGIA